MRTKRKNNKKSSKPQYEKIILATLIIELIKAIIELIDRLLE
ncbi:MAG: hypothetical protein PUG43_01575 [Clostridiales bacterium]|nr:hypothetical protein [Clostridiales bacterium]